MTISILSEFRLATFCLLLHLVFSATFLTLFCLRDSYHLKSKTKWNLCEKAILFICGMVVRLKKSAHTQNKNVIAFGLTKIASWIIRRRFFLIRSIYSVIASSFRNSIVYSALIKSCGSHAISNVNCTFSQIQTKSSSL